MAKKKEIENSVQEVFSAQTRQTKTALMLFSATLFMSTIFGTLPDPVSMLPFGYTVSSNIFFGSIFLGTLYFAVSFFISASYERRSYGYVKKLSGVKDTIEGASRSLKGIDSSLDMIAKRHENRNRNLGTAFNDVNMKIFNAFMLSVKSDIKNYKPQMEYVREYLEISSNYFRKNSTHGSQKKGTSYPDDIDNFYNEVVTLIDTHVEKNEDWLRKIEHEERNLEGFAAAKNDMLEFYFPLTVAVLSIFSSSISFYSGRSLAGVF